ncbi:MAG: glycerophosphodiester phosphodiesterase [Bdellovibrionota bacterium]
MAEKVLITLKDYGIKDILFSSFDHYFLKILRLKSKEARIAMLDDRVDQGPKINEAKDLKAEAYNVNLKRLSIENVHFIKAAGLKVFAYTVKNKRDLVLADGLQVDAIFSDNLEECLA